MYFSVQFVIILCAFQVSYLEVDEAHANNKKHLAVLRQVKIYGNREPSANAVAGFRSGGTPKVLLFCCLVLIWS